jgi:N-glycosylase/DNA lyase
VATTIELRGPGGEPVDFRRVLASHGVATLPPNRIDEQLWTLERGKVRVSERSPGSASVEPAAAVAVVRRMLNLDEDLSGLYALAAEDPDLGWITRGAGRMLRSPTVFEDVVKTICTTNCTWAATVRMVSALVDQLGDGTFPTPEAMAGVDESFYREVIRAAKQDGHAGKAGMASQGIASDALGAPTSARSPRGRDCMPPRTR